jgi:hypothetical protein
MYITITNTLISLDLELETWHPFRRPVEPMEVFDARKALAGLGPCLTEVMGRMFLTGICTLRSYHTAKRHNLARKGP